MIRCNNVMIERVINDQKRKQMTDWMEYRHYYRIDGQKKKFRMLTSVFPNKWEREMLKMLRQPAAVNE